ncbi:MAG: TOBE domain-containing protein, partial [Bradyrhizobium sp.]
LGREVQVSIRAEAISIRRAGHASASALNRLTARVTGLRILGPLAAVQIDAGLPLKAYVLAQQARDLELAPGQAIEVDIPPGAIHLMDVQMMPSSPSGPPPANRW